MMRVLGIDEAGRGPVIGPMVIVGVLVRAEDLARLEKAGVKDSKTLSPRRREALAREIESIARRIIVREVPAQEIDNLRKRMSLNEIEAMKMAEIIEESGADKVFIDLPDPTPLSFERRLSKYCSCSAELVMEHKADQKYPVVSAASIIAKTLRDKRIKEIEEKYGTELGTGYPHDERTIKFLREHSKEYPPEVRRSWSTARRQKKPQKKLSDYC